MCRWCGSWTKCSSSPTLGWSVGCTMTSSSLPAETTETPALFTSKDTFHRFHLPSCKCAIYQTHTQVFIPKQRKYLVVFPEGGFLHKRKEVCILLLKYVNLCHLKKWQLKLPQFQASNRFAAKLGLPPLEHCTLPRFFSHLELPSFDTALTPA